MAHGSFDILRVGHTQKHHNVVDPLREHCPMNFLQHENCSIAALPNSGALAICGC